MELTLLKVGNSRAFRIPAKSIRERHLTDNTRFLFKEDEDGYHFLIVKDPVIPKLTKPLKLSKGMQSLLADPVTFSEEEKEDPVIRHLLDEDFR